MSESSFHNDEGDFSTGKGRSREGKHGLIGEVDIQVAEDASGDGMTVTFKYDKNCIPKRFEDKKFDVVEGEIKLKFSGISPKLLKHCIV